MNDFKLQETIAQHGLTLRPGQPWRVLAGECRGTLRPWDWGCEVLVTDGIIAWVKLDDGRLFHCHLAAFEPRASEASIELESSTRLRKPKPPSAAMAALMELE